MSSTDHNAFLERARYEADRYGSDSWVFVRELLQNARDAGATTVQFETIRVGRSDRIICRDDGSGMSFAHARKYLFTLYASSKSGRSKSAGRFGIGFWSVLRFSPQTIIVRSRLADRDGWQVQIDGELERFVREKCVLGRGTEVVLERPAAEIDLGAQVRAAVLRDAPFLNRRGRGDRPLEVLVDGEPVRAEPELPAPSLSFHRRGLRGAVGLGAQPRVEVFAHGLRVRDAAGLDELLLSVGRKAPPLPLVTEGLAPHVVIDSRDLSVLMARGDTREDRALRRVVAIGHRELSRLVRAELDRFSRPTLRARVGERLNDLWSTLRARWVLVGCAAIALSFGVGWLGMNRWSEKRDTSIGNVIPRRGSNSTSARPEPYRGLDRTYRGPTVETLEGVAPPVDLRYRPTEERPFIASLLIAGLDADGSPVAGEATWKRLEDGPTCSDGCIEIEIGVDAEAGPLGLPVPSGHVVDADSVRLDGVLMPVIEMSCGQPAIRLETPYVGRLRYRTGPGAVAQRAVGTDWPELPAELEELAREIDVLPRTSRALVAADSVRRLVVYDTSATTAARYREAREKGLGLFDRSLVVGAGDCDVQNSMVAAILERSGVPARLAVGWLGVDGRVQQGLHAWVEFLDEDGVWRVVDASVPDGRDGPQTAAPQVAAVLPPASRVSLVWMSLLVAVLVSAGLVVALRSRRWRRHLHVGSETDVPDLLRGAATRPQAFARIRPLFTRRVVPLLGRSPISLARARSESLHGRLCRGSRRTRLATKASMGGGVVIDAELSAGRAVAEALGAVDLDRWQILLDRSRSADLTSKVEEALASGGQRCRLRLAEKVGQEMTVLDGGLLGLSREACWA